MLRYLALILLIVLIVLQVHLWTGQGGMREVWRLQQRVEEQKAENAKLKARNETLSAEVDDLKHGDEAIEERARVASGTEGRVDVPLAGQDGERIDHFIDQDGNVRRIGGRRVEGGHSVIPFSAMKKRAAAFCTSVALSQSISVFGSQISKKSSTPQKKACAPICA